MSKLKTSKTKSDTEIILTGELTIREMSNTKELFLKALKKKKNLSVDLSECTEFDASFLQLLVAVGKSCSDENLTIEINPSLPVEYSSLLNDAGVSTYKWLAGDSASDFEGGKNE